MKKNGELKIEKGIPIPSIAANGEVTSVLAKMEVGDSLFVQYFCGKGRYSDRFKLRTVDGGTRIWRIA